MMGREGDGFGGDEHKRRLDILWVLRPGMAAQTGLHLELARLPTWG